MTDLLFLNKYLKKYRGTIILGLIFVVFSNICSTYIPRIIGEAIDQLKLSFDKANHTDLIVNIDNSIILLLVLTAASGIFMFFSRRTIIVVSRKIEYDLRKDFLFNISSKSMKFFNLNKTGSIMAHATNDISASREFIGPAFMYGANTIAVFIFALYFMIKIDLIVTLIALIPLPLIALAVFLIGKKIHELYEKVQAQFAELSSFSQESFSGIYVLKSFMRMAYESMNFKEISKIYLNKNLKLARLQAFTVPLIIILVGLTQLIVLAAGGYRVLTNHISLGDLTQFFIYLNMMIWPVVAIGWIINIIQRASASVKRLKKMMEEGNPEYKSDLIKFTKLNNEIKFDKVGLKYENSQVLENLSFTIPLNQTIGIVGAIGSGKTSIANLLIKLFVNSKGSILIDGININDYSNESIREKISYVPQDTFLFSTTINENIKFGNSAVSNEKVIEISKLVSMSEEIENFPEKYNTLLGERGITLSGGQKQRVSIARALITNPDILILDDSLSAVDIETESKILNNIKKFVDGKTMIIISHRLTTISFADKIIVIDKGQKVEEGTHAELMKLQGRYYHLHKIQAIEHELEII